MTLLIGHLILPASCRIVEVRCNKTIGCTIETDCAYVSGERGVRDLRTPICGVPEGEPPNSRDSIKGRGGRVSKIRVRRDHVALLEIQEW